MDHRINLFFSYSRKQVDEAKDLFDFLNIYHECWFDSQIGAGSEWWAEILSQIRNCDIFIFILSKNSETSKACLAELNYAHALGKFMVVLQIEEINPNFIPHILKSHQITMYLPSDNARKNQLSRKIKEIKDSGVYVRKMNPNILEPPIPLSELSSIHSEIMNADTLSENEQILLLYRIEVLFKKKLEKDEDIIKVLKDFDARPYIIRNMGDKILKFIKEIESDFPSPKPLPTKDPILKDIITTVGTNSDDKQIVSRLAPQSHEPMHLLGIWKRVRSVQNYQQIPIMVIDQIIFNQNYSFQAIRNNMQTGFGSYRYDTNNLTITFSNGTMDTRAFRVFKNELYIVQYMNYTPYLIDCYERI